MMKIEGLELSVRSENCLKHDGIIFIGDLVQRTEVEMLRVPNCGRKSLNEVKESLEQFGLQLGTSVTDWARRRGLLLRFVDTPFLRTVDEIELSSISSNRLLNERITFVGELVQRTEAELLRAPAFGRKSVSEIKEVLAQLGLSLGMEIVDWPQFD